MAKVSDTDAQGHWSAVYRDKPADSVSWYQDLPQSSIDALARAGATQKDSIIDIGGGASALPDALIAAGWRDIAVLDIAESALALSKRRLGQRAQDINWLVADIRDWHAPRQWDYWHDRAVFHFLTGANDRAAYRRAIAAGLRPGGKAILATFAADGPETCSGLPVARYSPEALAAEFAPEFTMIDGWGDIHHTPSGGAQAFSWVILERR